MSEAKKIRVKTRSVFEEESNVLKQSRTFLQLDDLSLEDCKKQLLVMQGSYDELLDQAKLITKVSDRLQKKINNANDELEYKNVELNESLDALTKAKVGRKAVTITLFVVVGLLVLTEAFVEPYIDAYTKENFTAFDYADTIGALLAKAVIALSLRPIEKIVEKRLMKQESNRLQAERELAKKNNTLT